jgi:hypothetical protein
MNAILDVITAEADRGSMRLDADTLARLSHYLTGHVDRFGEYRLDLNRQSPPIDYQLPILGF